MKILFLGCLIAGPAFAFGWGHHHDDGATPIPPMVEINPAIEPPPHSKPAPAVDMIPSFDLGGSRKEGVIFSPDVGLWSKQSAVMYFSCNKSAMEGFKNGLNGISMTPGSVVRVDRDPSLGVDAQQPIVYKGSSPKAQIGCKAIKLRGPRENIVLEDKDNNTTFINLVANQSRRLCLKTLSGKPVFSFFHCVDDVANAAPSLSEGVVVGKGSRLSFVGAPDCTEKSGHQPFAGDTSHKPNTVLTCD